MYTGKRKHEKNTCFGQNTPKKHRSRTKKTPVFVFGVFFVHVRGFFGTCTKKTRVFTQVPKKHGTSLMDFKNCPVDRNRTVHEITVIWHKMWKNYFYLNFFWIFCNFLLLRVCVLAVSVFLSFSPVVIGFTCIVFSNAPLRLER